MLFRWAPRSLMILPQMLHAALRYRGFILSSVVNEVRSRFARSRLGALWLIAQPLSQVLIYTLVLANVLQARMPGVAGHYDYALYLLAGFLCWTLFSEILLRCTNIFIEFGTLLKKTSLPKASLPVIVLMSSLWNNFILLGLTFGAYLLSGHGITFSTIPLVLLLTAVTALFALSLGTVLGILNVFFRDIGHVLTIMLQLLFWLTPIVYSTSIIPQSYRQLIYLNPLAHLVEQYQRVLMFKALPEFLVLVGFGAVSLALIAFSVLLLRKASGDMMDVL